MIFISMFWWLRLRKRRARASELALLQVLPLFAFVHLSCAHSPRARMANVHRDRMNWEARVNSLDDRRFRKRYRLSKSAFSHVVDEAGADLFVNEVMAANASPGGAVLPEIRVAMEESSKIKITE